MDSRYSDNDELRALPYNFTGFGANCMVFTEVIIFTGWIIVNEKIIVCSPY